MRIVCFRPGYLCPAPKLPEEVGKVLKDTPHVQEAETRLDMMLREGRLSSSISPLIRESFLQSLHNNAQSRGQLGNATVSDASTSAQLRVCREQLQRRSFLMKHCSAETRLALAACDWAAEKSQASCCFTEGTKIDRAAPVHVEGLLHAALHSAGVWHGSLSMRAGMKYTWHVASVLGMPICSAEHHVYYRARILGGYWSWPHHWRNPL